MPYIPDAAFDLLLNYIQDNVEALHICSAEPANYAGLAAVDLGNKQSPSVAEPSDRTPNGREIVVSAITDGSVTATDTATHWALVKDTATSELLATGALSASQGVTSANTFTLTQFAIGVPDAV
jgi:hypothetical protein